MKSFIRILIVVGIVAAAAFAVWQSMSGPKTASVPDASTSPSLAPVASVSPLTLVYDTAPKDWKTYSSASMGFSVSYPPDWRVGVCGPLCVGWAPPKVESGQYALGIVVSKATISEVLEKAGPYLAAKEDIKLGSLTWLKLTLQQPQTGTAFTSHFITRGANLFEFGTATTEADIIAVYGRMLASFRFLK